MPDQMIRIFLTADIGEAATARLREHGYEIEVYPGPEAPPKSVIVDKVGSGIDVIITTLRDPIDKDVLRAGEGTLKLVAQFAVGFDNIDRDAANRYKIPFANTPDVLTEATAEFALFMLGALSRRLYSSEKLVEENRWRSWHPYYPILGDEVTCKTVGIVGAGSIGKAFAKKCIGFDMSVLLFSPRGQHDNFVEYAQREMDLRFEAGFSRERQAIAYVSFEGLLERSDYVSLHVPLLLEGASNFPTRRLMSHKNLARMKRSAYLINTSRGQVVDEDALYDALINEVIAGAALDVFETEPLPADSPLRDPVLRDRLRLFHHFASGTNETRLSIDPERGMAGRCVQTIIDLLEGSSKGDPARLPFVVNKEAFAKA